MCLATLLKVLKRNVYRVRRSLELNRYNDFTIAEYFRRQGVEIGENNRIEIRSFGTEPYLIRVGNHCTIGPNVSFITHDGGVWVFSEQIPSIQKFAPIKIMDNCFIGLGAMILGGVTIGPNSIVGAGSVVTKDVPPNSVVAGNPARVVSTIEEYRKKAVEMWEMQKPRGYFGSSQEGGKYSPEDIQKMKFKHLSVLEKHLKNLFRVRKSEGIGCG